MTSHTAPDAPARDTSRDGKVGADEREHLRSGFGKLLRAERRRAELTQAKLAALSGLTVRSIERYEAGDIRPREDVLRLLGLLLHRPRPVVTTRGGFIGPCFHDEADELTEQMRTAAGDSIRPGWGGRGGKRAKVARELMRSGMTPDERTEQFVRKAEAGMDRMLRRAQRESDNGAMLSASQQQLLSKLARRRQ